MACTWIPRLLLPNRPLMSLRSAFHCYELTREARKFPSSILTQLPINVDLSLAKEHLGVYSFYRFMQDGSTINRVVVVLSYPEPPLSDISFEEFSSLNIRTKTTPQETLTVTTAPAPQPETNSVPTTNCSLTAIP